VAGGKKRWIAAVTAYTLAGSVSSLSIGAMFTALGSVLGAARAGIYGVVASIVVAVIAMAREFGWLSIPLPQLTRQTRDTWAKAFNGTQAAALWGFDLGLTFTTWLTFSGVWLLAVVAILAKESAFGATLFTLYWFGRAGSVWLGPLLLREASATSRLLHELTGQHLLFQRIHAMGLMWSVVVLVICLVRGTAI